MSEVSLSNRTTLVLLIALVAAHVALGIFYASITPWRTAGILMSQRKPVEVNGETRMVPQDVVDVGAPDERQHTNYIGHLAREGAFPVFDPKDPNLGETYQSHQPPAYYVAARGWSAVTRASLAESDIDARSTGFKLRIFNVLMGAATVVGVFFLAFWGFRRDGIALVAAAFAALLPMHIALNSAVSNDPMLFALCTWVLALSARGIRRGWTWKLVVGVGILTGLALLTKTTAVALLPALFAAAMVPQTKKPSVAMAGVLVLVALVVAGPWWARNQSLYGDPLAMGAFNQAFQGSPQKAAFVEGFAAGGDPSPELTYWKDWVGWWTARSFFGAFGYMDIWMTESGRPSSSGDRNTLYRLLLVGMLVVFLGWVLASSKPEMKEDRSIQIINGVFLIVVVILFLRFNMQYFQAQARYVFPAIGPIACGVGIGLNYFFKQRAMVGLGLVAAILLGVNLYALSKLPEEFRQRTELVQPDA